VVITRQNSRDGRYTCRFWHTTCWMAHLEDWLRERSGSSDI